LDISKDNRWAEKLSKKRTTVIEAVREEGGDEEGGRPPRKKPIRTETRRKLEPYCGDRTATSASKERANEADKMGENPEFRQA